MQNSGVLQSEKHREHTRLSRQIRSIRTGLRRCALEDLRVRFFENADHEEIEQQLEGSLVSEFAYLKPEFG